jgi:hypothetical protein
MFYNNEHVLPYWSEEVIKLIHYLGTARYPRPFPSLSHVVHRQTFTCPSWSQIAEIERQSYFVGSTRVCIVSASLAVCSSVTPLSRGLQT